MITLTITGENPKEFLEQLAGFLSVKETTVEVEEIPKPRKTREKKEEKAETPTVPPVMPPLEDDGLGEPEKKALTIEEVRAIGRDVAKIVGPDKVRELVTSMGVESLPKITPDKFDEFVTKVRKLTA
jgi:hypothetical protein